MEPESSPAGPSSAPGDLGIAGERAALARALAAWQSPSDALVIERPSFTGYPFTLGVASGAPLPSGVVFWTRLAPEPLGGGGVGPDAMVVRWEVAEDELSAGGADAAASTRCRRGRTASMSRWRGLSRAHWYFYRFMRGRRGRARSAARGPRRRGRPGRRGCASGWPRASTSSMATTPRTATCSRRI